MADTVECKISSDIVNPTLPYTVLWDSEITDTLGFHSTTSNTSRITVPSGVKRLKLNFCIVFFNTNGSQVGYAEILKNGSSTVDSVLRIANDYSIGFTGLQGTTGPIEVEEGDYFEVRINCPDSTITIFSAASHFSAIALEETYPAAMVKLNSDQVDISTSSVIEWDDVVFDNIGAWKASNPTRLTVPYFASKVIVGANIYTNSSSNFPNTYYILITIRKNGADTSFIGKPSTSSLSRYVDPGDNVCSVPLDVSPGDYFEVSFSTDDTAMDLKSSRCNFWLEVIE